MIKQEIVNENILSFDTTNLQCIVLNNILIQSCIEDIFYLIRKKEFVYSIESDKIHLYKNTMNNIREEIKDFIYSKVKEPSIIDDNLFNKEINSHDILMYSEKMSSAIFTN